MWRPRREPATTAVIERASEAARRLNTDLLGPASPRVWETLPHVAQTVRKELAPRVAHAVETAGDVAAGRQRQLAEVARRARASSGAVLGEVAGAVTHVPPLRQRWRGRRARRVGNTFVKALTIGLVTNASHRARQATGRAAKRAGALTADAAGALFWLAAAAAVLLFGYASAEQRARIAAFVKAAREQAAELYRDLQGYDEAI